MAPSRRNKIGKGANDKIKDLLEKADKAFKELIPQLDNKKEEEQIDMFKPALTILQTAANLAEKIDFEKESIPEDEVKSIIKNIEKNLGVRPDDNTSEKEVNETYYDLGGENYTKFGELSPNKTLLPIKTKVKNEKGTPTYKDGIYEGPDNENLIFIDDYKKFGPDGTENRGYPLAEFRKDMEEAENEPCPKPGLNNDKGLKKLAPDSRASVCATRLKKKKEELNKKCDESNACRNKPKSGGGSRHTRRKRGKSSKRKSSKKSRKTKRKSLKKRRTTRRR